MVTLRVIDIVDGTTVDGPGLRTSIYFAGCAHHCPACHNPQSWDFAGGREMTVGEIVARVVENDFDVTFSGGDPMFQAEAVEELARAIREAGKRIWCYTGYTFEQVAADARMAALLRHVDVLVDGRFDKDRRELGLLFRGSANQRLVDVARSTPGDVTQWSRD